MKVSLEGWEISSFKKWQRNFLWILDSDQRKINWVRWKEVCRPLYYEGLGLRSIKETNRTLLSKWLWKYGKDYNALWRNVVSAKYGEVRNG